jgi:membrane associated rhomboid family serine protease
VPAGYGAGEGEDTVGSMRRRASHIWGVVGVVALSGLGYALGTSNSELLRVGMMTRVGVSNWEMWRFVSYGFLHMDAAHFFYNMGAVLVGAIVCTALGMDLANREWFLIYMSGLVGGGVGHVLMHGNVGVVGASGAAVGIYSAALVFERGRGVGRNLWGVRLASATVILTAVLPVLGVEGASTASHVGGAGAGVVAGLYLSLRKRVPQPRLTVMEKGSKADENESMVSQCCTEREATSMPNMPLSIGREKNSFESETPRGSTMTRPSLPYPYA